MCRRETSSLVLQLTFHRDHFGARSISIHTLMSPVYTFIHSKTWIIPSKLFFIVALNQWSFASKLLHRSATFTAEMFNQSIDRSIGVDCAVVVPGLGNPWRLEKTESHSSRHLLRSCLFGEKIHHAPIHAPGWRLLLWTREVEYQFSSCH